MNKKQTPASTGGKGNTPRLDSAKERGGPTAKGSSNQTSTFAKNAKNKPK